MAAWNQYCSMGVKHGLLQVKVGVKSKLLLIDVWDTSYEYISYHIIIIIIIYNDTQ
jgi:hypothetical protein